MDRHGDAARGRRGHTTRWSVVRDVVRQTVTQRRLPPQVVAYGRALVADRWSRARRRVRRALSAPVRHRRRGTDPAAPRVVHSGGRRQAAVPFGFTTVREVAEDNLRRVADLFERSGVAYHVRDAAGPGPITVMVDAADHAGALAALTKADASERLYGVAADGGGSPVPLHREVVALPRLLRADRLLVYRNHRVSDDYVVGASHGCLIEFWERAGANLRPPEGARPGRIVSGKSAPGVMVVGGRRYPTLHTFTDRAALDRAVDFPVDVVYTWVNDADPAWRRAFAAERARQSGLHRQAANVSRYRNRDELRYSLRSLAMYASFVRNIYIVTAGQVPDWLDATHPAVTIVDHDEILAPGDLPTFNSHAIESRLHHIDGLAEHYLYFNDDFILGREVTAATFFTPNGLAKVFVDDEAPIPPGPASGDDLPVESASKNVRDLLRAEVGQPVSHRLRHAPYAQRRSVLAEMEKRFPDAFERTAGNRFRQPDDVNVASCMFAYYAYATGRAVTADIAAEYINIATRWAPLQMRELLDRRHRDAFCLNETELPPERADVVGRQVTRFLDAYLPVPSPYELRDGRAA